MLIDLIVDYSCNTIFLYQSIVTLLTYLLVRTVLHFRQRHKRYQIFKYYGIPGPKPSLLGGSIEEAFSAEQVFLNNEKWAKQYGKFFGFFIGDEPSIMIYDLDLSKKIFLENGHIFKERCENFLYSYLVESVLFASYPRWKYMRKVFSVPFGSHAVRGTNSTQFVENTISLMLEYIEKKFQLQSSKHDNKIIIDLQGLMKATSLHMVNGLAIELPNVKVEENEEHVINFDAFMANWNKGVVKLAIIFPVIRPFLQFIFNHFELNTVLGALHKKVDSSIKNEFERLQKTKQQNLDSHGNGSDEKIMNTMLRLHYENKLSRAEVMGNVEAILMAGYDTTSTTLTYIFWVLSKYPDIQEELRQDLLINGLQSKFLEQVIKETMRLYPTVMTFIQRIADKTLKIDDTLTIPEGTRLVYNAWIVSRNPEIWPEPEKFDPSRFDERNINKIHPCAFAPFGFSFRKCLGYQLADLELRTIVCDILIRYKIHLISPNNLELVTYSNILSKPKEKVVVALEKLQ